MSIAVIIPLFNGGPWIREALESILVQDMLPEEIVVVDDGSTDGSPEIVRAYPMIKLISTQRKGSSAARNIGLFQTSSPFVAFLDQDDVWHPSHLKLLIKTFQKYPEANTVVTSVSDFQEGLPNYRIAPVQATSFNPWTNFPFTIGIAGPSVALIRRSALMEIGMWDEKATGMGDALLFLKLAVLHPLIHLEVRTVGKRLHPNQQWLYVRSQGTKYLNFRFKVMCMALDFRKKLKPLDSALIVYERRLKTLHTLEKLLKAIKASDVKNIPEIGYELEIGLSQDSIDSIRQAFYCLMGALFPTYDKKLLRIERDRVFSILLKVWPRNAKRTAFVLESMVGEDPIVT